MKKKNRFWAIFAIVVGVIIIAGLGGTALDNTKDLFKENESTPVESEDKATTTASVDYEYEVA